MKDENTLQYSERKMEELSALSDAWREKWIISLSVGNGAALLGLLNIIGDPAKRSIAMISPAYFFLFGLVVSVLARLIHSLRTFYEAQVHWARVQQAMGAKLVVEDPVLGKISPAAHEEFSDDSRVFWSKVAVCAEAASSVAFVMGCLVALVLSSLR